MPTSAATVSKVSTGTGGFMPGRRARWPAPGTSGAPWHREMAERPARVALFVCPACRQQHAVRVDAPRSRVACGAWTAASYNNGGIEALVWVPGEGRHEGRVAFLIDVQTVEPPT